MGWGWGLNEMSLNNEEWALIRQHNYPIGFPISAGGTGENAMMIDWPHIITFTWQFSLVFMLVILSKVLPWHLGLLCWVAALAILLWRAAVFALFVVSVLQGRYLKSVYGPSLVYWGWWPLWMLALCCLVVLPGLIYGSWLWSDNLHDYFGLKRLQSYRGVDTDIVPGDQLQDSGRVEFRGRVEVDRRHGGCFMNMGVTYCVAPITVWGTIASDLGAAPRTGSYDYFAVGKDCCSCPNWDFKCGEWNNPLANGGLRSLDEESRPFYRLAVESWMAAFRKSANHPLFFTWVEGPEWTWKSMWNRALHLTLLVFAGSLATGLLMGFLLDFLLQFLIKQDMASPRFPMAPPPGLDYQTYQMLPRMYRSFQQEQAQISAMPATETWTGPWPPIDGWTYGASEAYSPSGPGGPAPAAPGMPPRPPAVAPPIMPMPPPPSQLRVY